MSFVVKQVDEDDDGGDGSVHRSDSLRLPIRGWDE